MGLRHKLEALGYSVPAEIIPGEEAVDAASQPHPDVVPMDIRLSGELEDLSQSVAGVLAEGPQAVAGSACKAGVSSVASRTPRRGTCSAWNGESWIAAAWPGPARRGASTPSGATKC